MPVADIMLLFYEQPEKAKPTLRELSIGDAVPYYSPSTLKGVKRAKKPKRK